MDDQAGAKYLSLSQICSQLILWLFLFQIHPSFAAQQGQVKGDGEPLHYSGDKTNLDFRANIIELEGNAVVNRGNEHLRADRIRLDLNDRTIWAKGDCYYQQDEIEIKCDEINFSLDTSSGSVVGGRVTNGQFLLVGERINKLSKYRYQTHRGEYTTCQDCPGAWSLYGKDVDLEFGGYAHMSGVVTKVKDIPVFWFPYLVVPLKTERESGFLFPEFGLGSGRGGHGLTFLQEYFWATSRSTDMTFGVGTYTNRGFRGEWEGRYRLSENSGGTLKLYYNRDRNFPARIGAGRESRYGVYLYQYQELPWNIHQKLLINHVSDNYYTRDFPGDIVGYKLPAIPSQFILSKSSDQLSGFLEAKYYRSLLNFGINNDKLIPLGSDSRTVQLFPRVVVTTNDKHPWDIPLTGGVSVGLSNFTRAQQPFDEDILDPSNATGFDPGQDPIREALRFNTDSKIYTNFRIFDSLVVAPSVRYRGYYYAFDDSFAGVVPNFWRGYLLFQTELSFQMEKIYNINSPTVEKRKHVIRPTLVYNRIPLENKPNDHPFITQTERTDRDGFYFDNYDRVPRGEPTLQNYFTPLGHSISYGLVNQVFSKAPTLPNGSGGEVSNVFDFRAGQTLDILELEKDASEDPIPLSRLFITKRWYMDRFSWRTFYYYYPRVQRYDDVVANALRHDVNTTVTFSLEEARQVALLSFNRSIKLSYTRNKLTSNVSNLRLGVDYAINDNLMPSAGIDYNFISSAAQSAYARLMIIPDARCWNLDLLFNWDFNIADRDAFTFKFRFNLNLTGAGWGVDVL